MINPAPNIALLLSFLIYLVPVFHAHGLFVIGMLLSMNVELLLSGAFFKAVINLTLILLFQFLFFLSIRSILCSRLYWLIKPVLFLPLIVVISFSFPYAYFYALPYLTMATPPEVKKISLEPVCKAMSFFIATKESSSLQIAPKDKIYGRLYTKGSVENVILKASDCEILPGSQTSSRWSGEMKRDWIVDSRLVKNSIVLFDRENNSQNVIFSQLADKTKKPSESDWDQLLDISKDGETILVRDKSGNDFAEVRSGKLVWNLRIPKDEMAGVGSRLIRLRNGYVLRNSQFEEKQKIIWQTRDKKYSYNLPGSKRIHDLVVDGREELLAFTTEAQTTNDPYQNQVIVIRMIDNTVLLRKKISAKSASVAFMPPDYLALGDGSGSSSGTQVYKIKKNP